MNRLLFLLTTAGFAAPHITLPEKAFEFGTVIQGDVVSHTFVIENTGDSELVIKEAKPSCGCTVGNLSSKNIKPGEKAELTVNFDSQNFQGKVHKSITISSNDSAAPFEQAEFTADIQSVWELTPGHLDFNEAEGGKKTVQEKISLIIRNHNSQSVAEVRLETDVKELSFDKKFPYKKPKVKAGDSLTINIQAKLKEKLETTKYGHVDIEVRFEDGRTMKKKLGLTIKKWGA